MTLSKEPTEWILAHAGKVMELNNWYFILVHIDNGFKEKCQHRLELIKNLSQDNMFYKLSFWESPYGWYKNTSAIAAIIEQIIDSEHLWTYVSLDNAEDAATLALTEQRVTAVHFDITIDGYGSFTGIGSKTNCRFFSIEIPLYTILNQTHLK